MERTVTWQLAGAAMALLLTSVGCSGPRPILQPNAHLETMGKEGAQEDIDECRSMAKEGGSTEGGGKAKETATSTAVGAATGAASGAVGGAVAGAAGSGSAIGAASGAIFGLLSGLLTPSRPNPTYINFVNRCLNERGYDVAGWE
jgi:hypothetical protein